MRRASIIFAGLAILSTLQPPAVADGATFTAPYPDAAAARHTRTDGTPWSFADAHATAAAPTGDLHVDAFALEGFPAGVGIVLGGASGLGMAEFRMPSFQSTTGHVRGVVTLKGSASASAGTVAGTATGQVGVAVLRAASGSPTPPPTFGPVSPPPGTPLARAQVLGALGEETDDRPDQTFTASYELTRSGSSACPAPQAMNLVVQVFASAIVASASQARSTGDLVLDSVTVQDVPCVSPSPPTPTPT